MEVIKVVIRAVNKKGVYEALEIGVIINACIRSLANEFEWLNCSWTNAYQRRKHFPLCLVTLDFSTTSDLSMLCTCKDGSLSHPGKL